MGKPSAPPPPDYKGAAEQTAKSQQTSQYTPYGSQVYSPDSGSPSGYKSTISLTPQAQGTLDTQMGLSKGLGDVASGQLPGIQQQYAQPLDLGGVQGVADKAYGAMTSRLDPQWAARDKQNETKLVNQGLRPGGEAYDNGRREFNNARNDAYQQANLGAIQTMPQTQSLAMSEYQQPLNIFNALRTGAQVQNPQFTAQPTTNYIGASGLQGQAEQQQFGTEAAQYNAMMQGLFGLGAAGVTKYSDRRLKSNVVRVGTHPLGIGIYEYDIGGEREAGVMADEVETVRPWAVGERDGFKTVDYGQL